MPTSPQKSVQQAPRHGMHSVSIVGGGVAGLAAACALADEGYRVTLFERRAYVGGRASSYEHPGTGEVIDNCQHILVGCCTNLINLYHRIGVEDKIRWFDRITFVEPGGVRSVLEPSVLPAPLHSSLSFLRAHAFSLADKLAISRGLMAFVRGIPEDSDQSFADWLVKHRQTKGAIERFWRPTLISALNEDADRISVRYAGMVIREMFLRSSEAGRMGIPMIPLSDLNGQAMEYIRARGGEVRLRTSVDSLKWHEERLAWELRTNDATGTFSSDAIVLALSFEAMARLLPRMPQVPGVDELAANLAGFEHSPITSVHLWFDREITDLDHAALLDSKIDWMYHTSRLQPHRDSSEGSYLELVCSASRWLTKQSQEEIIRMAVAELGRFFPTVREAVLRKAAVVKEVRATYSIRPMLDSIRPAQGSPWPRAFLAGDWTATGWPATMEGAVRSGYLAAEALTLAAGEPKKLLRPDLASTGLMRLFD